MKKRLIFLLVTFVAIAGGGVYYWQQHNALLNGSVAIVQPEHPVVAEQLKLPDSTKSKDAKASQLKGRVNILFLGSDSRSGEPGRADSIMFISADFTTHNVSVISVPRDTRVDLPDIGLTKINHANAVGEVKGEIHDGTMVMVQAVSNLLGVPINDYLKINFSGFQKLIDALGGLDINLPAAVNDQVQNIHLSAGMNHLNGDQALRLARARYGLPNGDFDRQHDQFFLISAIAQKMLNVDNLKNLPQSLAIIHNDLLDTNLSDAQMLDMALAFKGISPPNVRYYQLPGQGISAYDPLVGANVYYYQTDAQGVAKVIQEAMQVKE